MASMGYCRHENALSELEQVWDLWDDWSEDASNEYEARARRRLIRLVKEMHESLDDEGAYDEDGD